MKSGSGNMRVISGFLKSRQIKGYDLEGTRPTMDKVKESVFAIIQDDIRDSVGLDLFAGSGSLGIEAISNGAKFFYFVDNNPSVIKVLNANIDGLNIKEKTGVLLKDYKQAINYFKDNNMKFDIIFLDPPYDLKIIESILKIINDYKLLNESGQVICEFEYDSLEEQYGSLVCIKTKKYGSKNIKIYKQKLLL